MLVEARFLTANRCRPSFTCRDGVFHFYSNEGNELMHVHAVKGDAECKYWIDPDRFDITEDFEYNCAPRLRREVRQIIFEHFDQIVAAWREHFGGKRSE